MGVREGQGTASLSGSYTAGTDFVVVRRGRSVKKELLLPAFAPSALCETGCPTNRHHLPVQPLLTCFL
jgi:hypothetical protein